MANRENPYSLLATPYSPLHSRHIEPRLLAAAVAPERAVLADRVGALEDPVLPRGQAREDFRFHRLGPDKTQIRFHAGEAVGREARALLEEHPDLVIPGRGSSDRARNSPPIARSTAAGDYRPVASRSACRSGRPRTRVRPRCRQSRTR